MKKPAIKWRIHSIVENDSKGNCASAETAAINETISNSGLYVLIDLLGSWSIVFSFEKGIYLGSVVEYQTENKETLIELKKILHQACMNGETAKYVAGASQKVRRSAWKPKGVRLRL